MEKEKTKILYIEDGPIDVLVIGEMLRDTGMSLESADSLSQGLSKLSQGHFDAVLLDLGLPDSQGINSITQIRAQTQSVPIVVFTGTDIEETGIEAIKQGAQDYLVKGKSGSGRLLRSIRYAIERKKSEETIHQLKQEMELILNSAGEGIICLDAEGRQILVNPAAEMMLGYAENELIGQKSNAICCARNAESDNSCLFFPTLKNGLTLHKDTEVFWKKDGSCIPVEFTCAPMRMNNAIIGGVVVFQDISERRLHESIEDLFFSINKKMLGGESLTQVLHYICEQTSQIFGLRLSWVGKKEKNGNVDIMAAGGPATSYVTQLMETGVRWDDTSLGRGPVGLAIKSGQIQVFKAGDPCIQPWSDLAKKFDIQAYLAIPLILRGETYGAFALYPKEDDMLNDASTLGLISSVASRICVGLEAAMNHQQLRLLGAALESAGNAVMIMDWTGCIQWVNESFCKLTGYEAREILDQNPKILNSGMHENAYYQHLWHTILSGKIWTDETVEKRRDGSLYRVKQIITPIRGENENITHFITIREDITAQKEAQEKIQHMAQHDALTDLPNRALFFDLLRQMMALALRHKVGLALLFLDLDRFKEVNDTYGHHVGDTLLLEVTQRLKKCIRQSDTLSRLAGDEFTVILYDISGKGGAGDVAKKIIQAISEPFILEGHEVNIGVSIGIAEYMEDTENEDHLVKCADSAMYQAKNAGRNTFCFYR